MDEETIPELSHYVAVFRGTFINKMTYIERIIELVIANHFCKKDKEIEFIDFLLGERQVSFEFKKATMYQILSKYHGKYYEQKKEMFDLIDYVQPMRNKIAHYMICMTDEAVEKFEKDKTFGLLQYYEKKKQFGLMLMNSLRL